MRHVAGVVGLAVGLSGVAAAETCDADRALAQRFAPLVWLAPDEQFRPIQPHAFAFDGLDNDLDGRVDFQDADEVGLGLVHDDVDALNRILDTFRPVQFTLPYSGSRVRADSVSTVDRRPGVLVSSVLRQGFAAHGVELSRYAEISPDSAIVRSYSRRGSLSGVDLADVPSTPFTRRPIHPSLVRGLIDDLDVDVGGADIALDLGSWAIYEAGTKKSAFRLVPEHDELGVYTRAHRAFDLIPGDSTLTVRAVGQLPPTRVLYHIPDETIEGHRVVQYWFYYPLDQGAGAHVHDLEYAFVFFDPITLDVSAVVGSAHSESSVNNILARGTVNTTKTVRPSLLPRNMPFLVELGKHAMAPDRQLDGRFNLGMDANVSFGEVWGIRDLAAAVGRLDIKKADPDHSFPRTGQTLLREASYLELRRDASLSDVDVNLRVAVEQLEQRTRAAEVLRAVRTAPATRHYVTSFDRAWSNERIDLESIVADPARRRETRRTYELVDAGHLAEFADSIASGAWDAQAATRWLKKHRACFGSTESAFNADVSPASFRLLNSWARHLNPKRDVWIKPEFSDSRNVFKAWLYPRMAITAEASVQSWLVGLRMSDLGPVRHSYLEPFVSRDWSWDHTMIGVRYDAFRGRHTGYTFGGALSATDVSTTRWFGGVVPGSKVVRVPGLGRVTLLGRVGVAADMRHTVSELTNWQLQLGVTASVPVRSPDPPFENLWSTR